jgi:DNA repair protein RadD
MSDSFDDIVLPVLREYQVDLTDRTRSLVKITPQPIRVVIQCETGGGKSIVGLDFLLRCYQKGKRGMFVVSGRALVNQFEGHLTRANVPFGIIMAGRGRNKAPIQIASKETLAARLIRRADACDLPPADLLIIDEAHESTSKEWVRLLDMYRHAVTLGLTATPALGNGKGLGAVYNGMEKAISTRDLVEQGWLVPCKVFAPDKPNLKGVARDKNGDYNTNQLAERMDRPKITGNVLTNWRKHADGRRTVVFCCTIQHAKHVCEEFNAAGIPFRHIDQDTSDEEREEIFRLIESSKVLGFTNVSVARRGLDLPCLEVACIVRPTRSLVLYRQMIGRIRRPSKATGKTFSTVIDHAGACDFHCLPDDEIEWSLDPDRKVTDWLKEAKDSGKIAKQVVCPKCDCIFQGPRCPSCGFTFKAKPSNTRQVEYADGILVERSAGDSGPSFEEMQRHWNKCIAIAANKDMKLGAAAHMFATKFGGDLPWTVPGLKNIPDDRGDWKRLAADVFPGFKRVKVSDAPRGG